MNNFLQYLSKKKFNDKISQLSSTPCEYYFTLPKEEMLIVTISYLEELL